MWALPSSLSISTSYRQQTFIPRKTLILTTTNVGPYRCLPVSSPASDPASSSKVPVGNYPVPVVKKRRRYRKMYPGESKGITEEMRFVAMRLRSSLNVADGSDSSHLNEIDKSENEMWIPTIEGFLKYLVDSKVVFDTLEGIIDRSDDVSCELFFSKMEKSLFFLSLNLECLLWFLYRCVF